MRGYGARNPLALDGDAPTMLVINAHAPHRTEKDRRGTKFPVKNFHDNAYLNTFFTEEVVARELGLDVRRSSSCCRSLKRRICCPSLHPDVIVLMGDFNRPLGPGEIVILDRVMDLLLPAEQLPKTYIGYDPPAQNEQAKSIDQRPWRKNAQNVPELVPLTDAEWDQNNHGPDHILMHVEGRRFGSSPLGECRAAPVVWTRNNWNPDMPFNGVASDHLPVFAEVELVPGAGVAPDVSGTVS